jgi:outer membrane protein assembly factor BamD (BamD/ComL family)
MALKRSNQLIYLFLCFFYTFGVSAQQQPTSFQLHQDALRYYELGQWGAAAQLWSDLLTDHQELDVLSIQNMERYFYQAALLQGRAGAENDLLQWLSEHPNVPGTQESLLVLADYAFGHGDYTQSAARYKQVGRDFLHRPAYLKQVYQHGFSLVAVEDFPEAIISWRYLADHEAWKDSARFYLGYIAYRTDSWEEALNYWSLTFADPTLNQRSEYLKTDVYFRMREYSKAISVAQQLYAQVSSSQKASLDHILGQCYFELGQYSQSIPYLSKTVTQEHNTPTDQFRLGYAYAQTNSHDLAVEVLNKITDASPDVAQSAWYQLGQSYLVLAKNTEARQAFGQASKIDFSLPLKEQALAAYAQLSVDLGNPTEDVLSLVNEFIKTFPNSTRIAELELLQLKLYVQGGMWEAADQWIDQHPKGAPAQEMQYLMYAKGYQAYQKEQWSQAADFWKRAYDWLPKSLWGAKSLYWSAESLLADSSGKPAWVLIQQLEKHPLKNQAVSEENQQYQKGYAAFSAERWKDAIEAFSWITNHRQSNDYRQTDAWNRLADAYWMNKNYAQAAKAYSHLREVRRDRSMEVGLQLARSYGLMGQLAQQASVLEGLVREHNGTAASFEARFEWGQSLILAGKTKEAMDVLDVLIKQPVATPYRSQAMMRQSLLHYNDSNTQSALMLVQKIAQEYPRTQVAMEAIGLAKRIYIDQTNVEAYTEWVATLGYVHPEVQELDQASYDAASSAMAKQKYAEAARAFSDYLKRYPQGMYIKSAAWSLAQALEKSGALENAMEVYYRISQEDSERNEQALTKYATLGIERFGYSNPQVIEALERMDQWVKDADQTSWVKYHLLRWSIDQKDWPKAVHYADYSFTKKVPERVEQDVLWARAQVALANNNDLEAENLLSQLSGKWIGEVGAEGTYHLARIAHQRGDWSASNQWIEKQSLAFSDYPYWSAQGLLLMADNFKAQGDWFQASFIWKSIVAHYTDFPVLVERAQNALDKMPVEGDEPLNN